MKQTLILPALRQDTIECRIESLIPPAPCQYRVKGLNRVQDREFDTPCSLSVYNRVQDREFDTPCSLSVYNRVQDREFDTPCSLSVYNRVQDREFDTPCSLSV